MSKLLYFNKKSDAIDTWKKTDDAYLFQLDNKHGKEGSKKFIIGNLDEIWDLIKTGKNSLYESWEDKPIHFGLDIDYPSENIIYTDIILHVKQIITGILLAVNQDDFKLNVDDVIVLENENQGNTKKEEITKYSFHVIFKGLVMENCNTAGKFYDNLEGIDLEGCDKSIYRKTCFRTCFSTKLNKDQTMVPIILDIGNKKTDNENNYDSLKEFWKNTLLINTKDYDISYYEKDEDTQYNSVKPSDIQTKELTDAELANIENILMLLPNKYFDDYYFWSKIGMILRNLNADQNKLLDMFKKFSSRSLTKYKGDADIKKYWKNFKNTRKNKIGLGSLFLWCKEEKISFTNNKGLDVIISEFPERKLEINYEYKEINERYFPIKEIENSWSSKLIGIQSEKGTGKTTSLFNYLFNQTSKNNLSKDDSVLFISSRRTFGIKLLGDIEKHGFKLYSECKEYYIDHNKMICQIDSILRLTNEKFKYVIIDECESLMRYLTSSHFTKNNKSSLIVSNFETKIMEAEKVIIMDADLCDRSITYYKNIMEVDKKDMTIVLNKFQPYSDYVIQYMAYSTWLKALMDKLDNKKKVVIPTASNNQAKDLKLLIEAHHPNMKVLLIHRETSDNDKLDQVINVNTKWNKYNVVIYTPSVCMGISFDDEYFDHIFAYGCENSLGSQEFCQMLHRVRKPKELSIYMTLDKFSEYDAIRHSIELNKIEEIICYDYYLTHFGLHNNMIPKKYKPNTKKDSLLKLMDGSGGNILILEDDDKEEDTNEYVTEKKFVYPYKEEAIYMVYLKNSQELILDRLNFANQLFGYFKMKGYKLMKHEWEDGEMIKNEIKEIRELRKEEELNKDVDGIFSASDITDDQFKELMNKRKEDLSQDDIYKLQKRNFKKCYVLDAFNKELLVKYKDITVMKYYHNLSVILPDEENTVEKRLEDLREDRVNNTYLNNAYSDLTIKNSYTKHKWAVQIINSLGFNLTDLEIRLAGNTIEDILDDSDLVKDIDNKLEYFIHKFNLAFPKKKLSEMECKDKIKFISKIIESQYGLTITKDNAKNYYLCDNNKWDELYEFRNSASASGKKLNDKIVKKIKENINIDQSWFEE
jgi:hypothetical protein